mmetsp:Transcript_12730/g.24529  ORF Transcript_12730/g.24529 Transcript_12730/m.24529 type:complete len:211 (-) Transcript_12730:829-1461(-)
MDPHKSSSSSSSTAAACWAGAGAATSRNFRASSGVNLLCPTSELLIGKIPSSTTICQKSGIFLQYSCLYSVKALLKWLGSSCITQPSRKATMQSMAFGKASPLKAELTSCFTISAIWAHAMSTSSPLERLSKMVLKSLTGSTDPILSTRVATISSNFKSSAMASPPLPPPLPLLLLLLLLLLVAALSCFAAKISWSMSSRLASAPYTALQ